MAVLQSSAWTTSSSVWSGSQITLHAFTFRSFAFWSRKSLRLAIRTRNCLGCVEVRHDGHLLAVGRDRRVEHALVGLRDVRQEPLGCLPVLDVGRERLLGGEPHHPERARGLAGGVDLEAEHQDRLAVRRPVDRAVHGHVLGPGEAGRRDPVLGDLAETQLAEPAVRHAEHRQHVGVAGGRPGEVLEEVALLGERDRVVVGLGRVLEEDLAFALERDAVAGEAPGRVLLLPGCPWRSGRASRRWRR